MYKAAIRMIDGSQIETEAEESEINEELGKLTSVGQKFLRVNGSWNFGGGCTLSQVGTILVNIDNILVIF